MPNLTGKVAVVTGASRGVGKGIALGLGEAGARVYVTGRTLDEDDQLANRPPGSLRQTVREIDDLGDHGIAVRCDHRCDDEVAAVFARVRAEQGRLDILVNNVWGGYEDMHEGNAFTWERPFWEQPLHRWDSMFAAGVRAHYVASGHAARMMAPQGRGLIANISFFAGQKYLANVAYGVAKAATDRLAADMAHELRGHGVTVLSLYPGLVRTEGVMYYANTLPLEERDRWLSNSESPQFSGRVVAALAADPDIMQRTGQVLVVASLAREYGIIDVDGKRPRPLTVEEA